MVSILLLVIDLELQNYTKKPKVQHFRLLFFDSLFKFRKYFFTTNFTNFTNLAARC